jgi:hypothetical protein
LDIRPDIDASTATGEEERDVLTKLSCNDAADVADNPEQERVNTNLGKPKLFRTWNVQGLNPGKLEIITICIEEGTGH